VCVCGWGGYQKVMLIYRPNGRRRLGIPFEETIRRGRNRSIKA